ncbi:MAG TPA: hypothetical protein ENK88_06665 [Campylobacterales bacterium]|nr:hypothetical protein [Campylobacterales bacterium]HHD80853.1 hypothetical protein [Campylobacterales bacterium]
MDYEKDFASKANFEILEGFLTELLKFDIKIEEILEIETNQDTQENKFNRVDILAKNLLKENMNIALISEITGLNIEDIEEMI